MMKGWYAMIIIVEGIDRVGKTTLCNKLKEELNIPIFKNERVCNRMLYNIEVELANQLTNFLSDVNCDVILDRFFYSEFVYGLADREYRNDFVLSLDEKLSKLNVLFILVEPTDIDRSSDEHGKDLLLHKTLFDYCFDKSKIEHKIKVDYSTLDDAVNWVRRTMGIKVEDYGSCEDKQSVE